MNTSADLMRDAATEMAYDDDKVLNAVARLIADAASAWDDMVENTQRPSRGIDQPPAIFHGQPEQAVAHADRSFADALHVARIWTEVNQPVSATPDAAMYGAHHFCTRCPDHDACASGLPCSVVLAQHAQTKESDR